MEQYDWDSQVPVSTRVPVVEALLSGGPIKDVLVVVPSLKLQWTMQDVVRSAVTMHCCSTFEEARSRLISSPPDLLVTSIRLLGHDGLQLVYLASRNPRTRCLVHLTPKDFALARDAEAAGAFVVRDPLLQVTLKSLVFGRATPVRSQTAGD